MRDHAALTGYLATRAVLPFMGFADYDCCVRNADAAVRAQTGRSPLKRLGRTWKTRNGAAIVLKKMGGLEAAVDWLLTPVAPSRAMRGDIALVATDDVGLAGFGLMIVEGETLVGPDASGARRLPRAAMLKAWSAGS